MCVSGACVCVCGGGGGSQRGNTPEEQIDAPEGHAHHNDPGSVDDAHDDHHHKEGEVGEEEEVPKHTADRAKREHDHENHCSERGSARGNVVVVRDL